MLVYVPIGPIPVPVTLYGTAFVSCSAAIQGPAKVTINVAAHANVGGSLRVSPSRDTSLSEWVKEGPWPAEAKGTATATTTAESTWSASITCALPRIEVHASLAGIAGPYLAVSPRATLNTEGATIDAAFAAGLGAGITGLGTGVEVNLYTWKP